MLYAIAILFCNSPLIVGLPATHPLCGGVWRIGRRHGRGAPPNAEDDEDSVSAGFPHRLPTRKDLKEYINAARLSFLLKGALSVPDAVTAKELGAAGVILNHHNGLMRWAMPPYALLPEIRKAVGTDFILIADGPLVFS